MRLLYTCLLYLAGPFILLRLWWRGRRQPEYRQRIGERLGRIKPPHDPSDVWVHAVSVGESIAAVPLIEALIARHGERHVWVTTTTPTGSTRVIEQFGQRVLHSYAPYDWPGAVARFLNRVQPRQIVVMETEIWPHLFRAATRRGIPLVIANARLSPRSFKGYSKLRRSIAKVLADCRMIAAQSDADAARFTALGAPHVQVMGNLKFDLSVPQVQLEAGHALRVEFGIQRPVWIAASTHDGEEAAVLAAHQTILAGFPDALLMLVPRHPQRFDAVWQRIRDSGFVAERRSRPRALQDDRRNTRLATTQVYLGDSMGEMFTYLATADLAFIGGSLVPVGGHNVLEPATLGLPVLFGPHMHNFEGARNLLLDCEAAVQVADGTALAAQVSQLLGDPARRARLGEAGRNAVAANRGALQRLLHILDDNGR